MRLPWLLIGIVFFSGCTLRRDSLTTEARIRATLEHQAACWNAADIDPFMDAYWRSPDLTFTSRGEVTRGWEPTRDRYHRRYPTRDEMGRLTFSDLEIKPLGRDAAYVLGRWRLERKEPISGLFTLVLRRIDHRWVIIHDHTSADER